MVPINLERPEKNNYIAPVWRMAFRPLFLLGSLFASSAILLWVAFLAGVITLQPGLGPVIWHAHEMLFGFTGAIVVGFLLTAVQTWTGGRSIRGTSLKRLVSIWIFARVFALLSGEIWLLMSGMFNAVFFWLSAAIFSELVFRAQNRRNYIFALLLFVLGSGSLMIHASVFNGHYAYTAPIFHCMVLIVTLIMSVIGGRVIPMFTANGMGIPRVSNIPWLETLSTVSIVTVLTCLIAYSCQVIPGSIVGIFSIMASLVHGLRAFRWRPWQTTGVPLVWALHLAYWFIPLGFALLGVHFLTGAIGISAGLHGITSGAMGCLILAMMSRVSLGHTGRKLVLPKGFSLAFYAAGSAAGLRILMSLFTDWQSPLSWILIGVLWSLGFMMFAICYVKILTQPRVDGHMG